MYGTPAARHPDRGATAKRTILSSSVALLNNNNNNNNNNARVGVTRMMPSGKTQTLTLPRTVVTIFLLFFLIN